MDHFAFWQRWLFVVSTAISIFGILMALFSGTIVYDLFDQLINPVFWGTSPIGNSAQGFQRFVYGVLGATLAGWGMFLSFISSHSYRNKEQWAWNCIVVGTSLWFVLDTTISLHHKVYINALLNIGLYLLVMLPIVFTKKYFLTK
jgi:hypothetical protein